MKPQLNEKGKLTGYKCDSCNGYNDLLTNPCIYCKTHRNKAFDYPAAIESERRGTIQVEIWKMKDDMIELHTKFYNHERPLVKDMDTVQLRERRLELQMIAFEARARISAVSAEENEREAVKGKDAKSWLLPTGNDPNVTDAINTVKRRKQSMSFAEKELARLATIGITGTAAEDIINNMIRAKEGKSTNTPRTIVDKRPAVIVPPTSLNTQESLLADISTSVINGIMNEKKDIDSLVKSANTAGHIANKILGPHPDAPAKQKFDPSSLFKKG